jgi:hypothetical protein
MARSASRWQKVTQVQALETSVPHSAGKPYSTALVSERHRLHEAASRSARDSQHFVMTHCGWIFDEIWRLTASVMRYRVVAQ